MDRMMPYPLNEMKILKQADDWTILAAAAVGPFVDLVGVSYERGKNRHWPGEDMHPESDPRNQRSE